jgi:hypothetical protein
MGMFEINHLMIAFFAISGRENFWKRKTVLESPKKDH